MLRLSHTAALLTGLLLIAGCSQPTGVETAPSASSEQGKIMSKAERPKLVNPFTGEPSEHTQWVEVDEYIANGNIEGLKKLFDEGMTMLELEMNYSNEGLFLHDAAMQGNLKLIQFLIEKGADPNVRDEVDHTCPLEAAVDHDQREIAKYLLDKTEAPESRKYAEEYLAEEPTEK
ncbi:ankyrin repeat domain-containing protein [Gimesia panareensis]|uniref:ankyrin repeat domain-containing protein n=1 Tax=Gimesia panareensis TaxID=2527978 RepID=UPI00118B5D1E|nr:ankyrin repeat domain-containing protein [Gimesia panareensis]QDU50241.1 Ankyrin repeats (3 copies) [Gimesia panareensis]